MKDLKKEPFSKKAGDKIEKLGEKVSNAGAQKVGAAISRAGDKLEHSQDKKVNTFDKNKSLQFYLRYNIWEDKKRKQSKGQSLLSLK